MQTRVKSITQIDAMREGGRLLAKVYEGLKRQVTAGVSKRELDLWVEKEIHALGAEATYKTAEVNFPGVICISVNDEIVHGVPNGYVLKKGDLVSFDLVIGYKGMKTDAAFTMVVDEVPSGAKKLLLQATERSLYAGIEAIKGPMRTGNISAAIEKVLTDAGLAVIRELVGHGVGERMHMAPEVPNFGRIGSGVLLQPGDTLAIEPMAALGKPNIKTLDDGWTIATCDGSLSAHFEHTVLITETGAEILTKL